MVNFIWENLFRPGSRDKNLKTLLSESYLFQNLSNSEIQFLMGIVHVRNFHSSEAVFRQGELGVGMYIIMKGTIEIIAQGSEEEEEAGLITELTAGDFFGELALFEENGKRTATARAKEDSILVGFFKPDLMEIIERNPSLGTKITFRLGEVLGRRLKETTNKVTELKRALRKQQNH